MKFKSPAHEAEAIERFIAGDLFTRLKTSNKTRIALFENDARKAATQLRINELNRNIRNAPR